MLIAWFHFLMEAPIGSVEIVVLRVQTDAFDLSSLSSTCFRMVRWRLLCWVRFMLVYKVATVAGFRCFVVFLLQLAILLKSLSAAR